MELLKYVHGQKKLSADQDLVVSNRAFWLRSKKHRTSCQIAGIEFPISAPRLQQIKAKVPIVKKPDLTYLVPTLTDTLVTNPC